MHKIIMFILWTQHTAHCDKLNKFASQIPNFYHNIFTNNLSEMFVLKNKHTSYQFKSDYLPDYWHQSLGNWVCSVLHLLNLQICPWFICSSWNQCTKKSNLCKWLFSNLT